MIKLRMLGGPGQSAVEVRSAGAPWLRGLSSGENGVVSESVWFPPTESGAVLVVIAHLTADMWQGHKDGHPLALLCDVQSREDPPRRWDRAGDRSAHATAFSAEGLVDDHHQQSGQPTASVVHQWPDVRRGRLRGGSSRGTWP